jgi:hypothetical protein
VNITFDLQELAQLLGKALNCTVSAENIYFAEDDCITLTDVSIETLTKASQEIRTVSQLIKSTPPTVQFLPTTKEEIVAPPPVEPADNFDDVMKISQQLAQTIPEESTEFPKEFMQGILSKIR